MLSVCVVSTTRCVAGLRRGALTEDYLHLTFAPVIPTVDYEKAGCRVDTMMEVKSSEMGGTFPRSSELAAIKGRNEPAMTTSLKDLDKRMKIMNNGMRSILHGFIGPRMKALT